MSFSVPDRDCWIWPRCWWGRKAGTLSFWDAGETLWESACWGTGDTHWEAGWCAGRIHWNCALWSQGEHCGMLGCCQSPCAMAASTENCLPEPGRAISSRMSSSALYWGNLTLRKEERAQTQFRQAQEGWIWNGGAIKWQVARARG